MRSAPFPPAAARPPPPAAPAVPTEPLPPKRNVGEVQDERKTMQQVGRSLTAL
jgi:hypothetical protein